MAAGGADSTKEVAMTAIAVGLMAIITAAVLYPFWPDTAVLGPLWSSIVMGGIGIFSILLGAWWKLGGE